MRRVAMIAITSLALVALVAPGVAARSHHASASFSAKTNTAVQGGALHIQAKVKHARRGSSFSARATVHFASGDVTVQLHRRGKSFVALANVPVDSNETPGAVAVDVTVTYNEDEQEVETEATVEDDQGDDTDCDPATTTCDDDDQGDDQGDDAGDDSQDDSPPVGG